jgi:hypothetical protein
VTPVFFDSQNDGVAAAHDAVNLLRDKGYLVSGDLVEDTRGVGAADGAHHVTLGNNHQIAGDQVAFVPQVFFDSQNDGVAAAHDAVNLLRDKGYLVSGDLVVVTQGDVMRKKPASRIAGR